MSHSAEMDTPVVTQADLQAALISYRDDASKRISDKIKALALGIVGFAWVLISSDKGIGKSIVDHHVRWIVVITLLAVFALALDLLHSVIYQLIVQKKLNTYKDPNNPEYSRFGYRFLEISPWIRTVICLAACGLLLWLVCRSLLFEL